MGEEAAVPLWPEEFETTSRQMIFLRGEPRWYFWIKSFDQHALLKLRRDLLLLHENGDLHQFKGDLQVGSYVTALDNGKMIRGRVLSPEARMSDCEKQNNSAIVNVLDIDEGTLSWLPVNQIRRLPHNMMTLPASAVRCDLDLDCEEQFKWPPELNDMIQRALGSAALFVTKKDVRPGSIPTIAAEITLFFSSTGVTMDLCRWLMESFSTHLDICGFGDFKPFLIGMGPMSKAIPYRGGVSSAQQHPMFSFNLQAEMLQVLQQQMCGLNMQPPPLNSCFMPSLPPSPVGFNNSLTAAVALTPPQSIMNGFSAHQQCVSSTGSSSANFPQQSMINEFISQQSYLYPVGSVGSNFSGSVHSGSSNSSISGGIDLSLPSDFYSSTDSLINSNHTPEYKATPIVHSKVNAETCSGVANGKEGLTRKRDGKSISVLKDDDNALIPSKIRPAKATIPSLNPPSEGAPSNDKLVVLKDIPRDWSAGTVVKALVAHQWDPHAFEVNVVDEFSASLHELLSDMSKFYKDIHISLKSKAQARSVCGEFCACYDPKEGIWFRAQVQDWKMDQPSAAVDVWCVDLGGIVSIELCHIQPLKGHLAETVPILATLCTMKNVCPRGDAATWSKQQLDRFRELMPLEALVYLRIDGAKSDECWPVSVFTDESCSLESINELLVAEQCASYNDLSFDSGHAATSNELCDEEDPMEEAFRIGGNNYEVDDEDACVAVSGRRFRDEEGICWAYQRNNGYCYKKMCSLRHVLLNPDGTTQDKDEVHGNAFNGLQLPEPGGIIKLSVSRVLSVHHFIAQVKIGQGRLSVSAGETLSSVLQNLNSPHMRRSLKTFTVFPASGEIVLAKNKSGQFFRGRTIDSDFEDDDTFEVLNVDDGHMHVVKLNDLRIVDPAFLHHPFQAVECWLANVVPTSDEKEWIKTCNTVFADMVKGKVLSATVIRSSPWGLEVNLADSDGRDIATSLKEMGMAKECAVRHLPCGQSNILPG